MSVPMHVDPSVRVVMVLHVAAFRGDGSPGDPERMVHRYYDAPGELLACYDPINGPPDAFVGRAPAAADDQREVA